MFESAVGHQLLEQQHFNQRVVFGCTHACQILDKHVLVQFSNIHWIHLVNHFEFIVDEFLSTLFFIDESSNFFKHSQVFFESREEWVHFDEHCVFRLNLMCLAFQSLDSYFPAEITDAPITGQFEQFKTFICDSVILAAIKVIFLLFFIYVVHKGYAIEDKRK